MTKRCLLPSLTLRMRCSISDSRRQLACEAVTSSNELQSNTSFKGFIHTGLRAYIGNPVGVDLMLGGWEWVVLKFKLNYKL